MKKLLYIVTLSIFAFNVSAESATKTEAATASDNITAQENASTASDKMSAATTESNVSSTETAETTQTEQSGISQGSVTRSIFTSQISEHEPIDKIEKLNSNNRSIYYFTELRDMSGQTAMHRWEFNGNVMAETNFTVAGPRWRVWSSKNLLPDWTGEWKVSVLNGVGDVISEDIFSYVAEEVSEPKAVTNTVPEAMDNKANTETYYTNDKLN